MKKLRSALACSLTAVILGTVAGPSTAAPVCPDEPRTTCGNRIFAEAENTVSFVQHDSGEYESGIKAIAKEFPRFVKVTNFTKLLGPQAKSFGERPLWLIEVTDFQAPEANKVPVMASLSVHGAERAGLEGGVRYVEDLARWASAEPDAPAPKLRNGRDKDSIALPVRQALKKVHLYVADINPDGWAQGDVQNGGVFMRPNGNGSDLNRQFPTMGWSDVSRPAALSEPEAAAWDRLARRIKPLITTDIHGELDSAQNAFADMMYPAGQWDPVMQAQHARLAKHMKSNVERYFEQEGVELAEATGVSGMTPAQYATGFDVVGYDDSGFMGDYFTQQVGAIDMDVEHFLSHMVPNSEWFAPLEEAHIAAVRAEIETLIVEATVTQQIDPRINLGKVGYAFDPKVISSADGYGGPTPPDGITPRPYRSTRMRFFRDLSRHTTEPLRKVPAEDVAKGGLRGLDTFVIADNPWPRNTRGKRIATAPRLRALNRFVKNGGNLVLTDGAARILKKMGVVPTEAVERTLLGAGHIDIEDWEDPYVAKVHETASQTYYEVPLGFSVATDSSPHWTIERTAWEDAGGKTIATVGEDTRVALGRIEVGSGTVGVLGAVLPRASEDYDHLFGLADYAVSVAGGQILNNMMR
jgi:hypothetical protein